MNYNYQMYLNKDKYGLNEIDLSKPKSNDLKGVNTKESEKSESLDLEKLIEELNKEKGN